MKKIGLNGFQLKWIALITMAVDHVGAILFPEVWILRAVGRISFPIFAFLLIEGFFHTRDIYRYMLRMGIFALVSEIPFDLAFEGTWWYPGKQNIFFTLFIGLALLCVLEKRQEKLVQILEVLFAMWFAEVLHTDYGVWGILLICLFYWFQGKRIFQTAAAAGWNFLWRSSIQHAGAWAAVFVALYNGEKGGNMKYLFYAFYPLHLLILYGIHVCIQG